MQKKVWANQKSDFDLFFGMIRGCDLGICHQAMMLVSLLVMLVMLVMLMLVKTVILIKIVMNEDAGVTPDKR